MKKIQIERFSEGKMIKKDLLIPILFLSSFLIIGFLEKNLILPGNGLGLFQHKSIWIFLAINILLPITIKNCFSALNCRIDAQSINVLKAEFANVSSLKSTELLVQFSRVAGFCFFIGNTLQNAKVINQLPFDYWDAIKYPISYIVSRAYKLYLFPLFIPDLILYIFVLMKSVAKLVVIREADKYPIANYTQIKVFCTFGTNIILALVIPVVISSVEVYLVHDRFDVTTIATILVSFLCAIISLFMYISLIKNYYVSLSDYKKNHIKQIDSRLAEIHHYFLGHTHEDAESSKLEMLLKEEEYLSRVKEDIETQNKFPSVIKALITSVTPLLPTIVKIISSLETQFLD